ncbi:nickel pincer cofactor biosynthesis protein LarC [Laspinema olomoucense]|uniref:nickel pincer cofactor biosynthesis protein LarC n=1 Tax=Laspinema olomoucense TaxID=3231600 RepID=UPI0021BA9798|nr:nickel pincer cofactor biosynthesis protein LarC [Laspinema sp. D3a]MCT7989921.1 nickel pincer cofactor biosynthesis protein LarC [Laspinema sp. D3a]
MKKIAYLQCPTGIAGDMFLGALVSAGVPFDYLREQLDCLGIGPEYQLRQEWVQRNTQQAMKIHVDLVETVAQSNPDSGDRPPHHHHEHEHEHHHHEHEHEHEHKHHHSHHPTRHLPEIEALIKGAQLPKRAETWSLQVFRTLAVAEGAVHGIAPEQVHFHEVGATDAIVDIVGTCLGLDWLGIEELYCSPLPTGGGTVWAAHGRLPVPVPAVLSLFQSRQVPVYSNGIAQELVTPTGAAIAVTLATAFGNPPPMTIHQIGLGAGSRDLPIPNILRLWVGELTTNPPDSTVTETITVLETQIDDANPQAIAYTLERLFAAGALDAFTEAISMKKSRTGILLTVICHPEQQKACEAVIFRETPTLGIRISTQQRSILHRELHTVSTPFGEVRVKVATDSQGSITNVQPEYEDCAQIARSQDIPWQEVHRQGLQAWYEKLD